MGALDEIIHPGMLEELEAQGHFPSTGTVQENTPTNVDGVATDSWANLAGHVDLDCAVAALTAREKEALDMTIATSTHKVLLPALYASITQAMRFVSGGVTYEITGVADDQHDTMTRLILKLITL